MSWALTTVMTCMAVTITVLPHVPWWLLALLWAAIASQWFFIIIGKVIDSRRRNASPR